MPRGIPKIIGTFSTRCLLNGGHKTTFLECFLEDSQNARNMTVLFISCTVAYDGYEELNALFNTINLNHKL